MTTSKTGQAAMTGCLSLPVPNTEVPVPRTTRIVQVIATIAVVATAAFPSPVQARAKPHKAPVVANASHRLYGSWFAHTLATNKVRDRLCGGNGYKCLYVDVPTFQCGYHSYCWSAWTHLECRAIFGQCIGGWSWRYTAGTVNGHTGYVTITRGTT